MDWQQIGDAGSLSSSFIDHINFFLKSGSAQQQFLAAAKVDPEG